MAYRTKEFTCEWCGQTFSRAVKTARFCGPPCFGAFRWQGHSVDRVCAHCNKPFSIRKSFVAKGQGVYCSLACKSESQQLGETRQCIGCGIDFYVSAANIRRGQCLYCSPDCYRTHTRRGEDRECTVCGASFYATPKALRMGWGSFCSVECRDNRGRTLVTLECEYCKRSFEVERRFAEGGQRFCSHECHYTYQRTKTEEAVKNWRYRQWRRAVYHRDNFTCQRCGQRGGELHAHHIKPKARYPELMYDLSNGETLCFQCHMNHHWPKLSLP